MARRTRAAQVAENRESLLNAALDVFRRKGYHGASVDEIAEHAGFSKGAVYSQFGSKDTLFLALLERRVKWRVARVLQAVLDAPEGAELADFWDAAAATQRSDPEWVLLVLEFRLHAARSPEINRQYAALHAETLAGVTRVLEALISRAGLRPRYAADDLARLLLAMDNGRALEERVSEAGVLHEISQHAVRLLLTEDDGGARPSGGEGSA